MIASDKGFLFPLAFDDEKVANSGITSRVLTPNPHKAQTLPRVAWVAGDLAKPETLTPACESAHKLFLLTSYYEDMVALQRNAIVAARTRRDARR